MRSWPALFLVLPACFSPEDPPSAGTTLGTDTDPSTMSGSPTSVAPSTGTATASGTGTTMTTTVPTTTDETSATTDGPGTSTSSDPTSGTSSGGEVMGECGNGEHEENELCLGDPVAIDLVCCPPTDMAAGDLDGNGTLDVALAIQYDAEVHAYLGDGAGGFNFAAGEAFGNPPRDVAVGQFDGDGLLDIAFPSGDPGDTMVNVIINDGGPSLTSPVAYLTGGADHIATGDLDGDGFDDIVSVGRSNTISVLRSNAGGGGTFTGPFNQSIGGIAEKLEVVVAEFNNNANLDVAVSMSTDQVGVCLGNGNGGFTGCNTFEVGAAPFGLAAGDFDGDSNTDLVTANREDNTLTVLWGQGNGGFEDEVLTIDTGGAPLAAAAGDLDNDGADDIATVSNTNGFVYVYRTDGAGGFTEVEFDQGDITLSPEAIILADVNDDGALDIMVGNSTASVTTFGLILSAV